MSEIAISGGGVVGASLALALARDGWQVELVERGAPTYTPSTSGFDLRVSALSAGSRSFLMDLGVDAADLGHPWHQLFAEAEAEQEHIHFDAADLGGEGPLGSIAENGRLVTSLWRLLETETRIQLRVGQGLEYVGGVARVGDSTIDADLLVGADGAQSPLRAATDVRNWELAPGQRAVVTIVASTPRRAPLGSDAAWQRFLETGPLAFLPLGTHKDGRCLHSIVWSCPEAMARNLEQIEDDAFASRLMDASNQACENLEVMDRRVSFPLNQQLSRRYVAAQGVVLVGDAAHVVHPLAGQGANMGLRDVQLLRDVLRNARAAGCSPGDAAFLRDYERRAAVENLLLTGGIAGQQPLWNAGGTLGWLRRRGLEWLRAQQPARRVALQVAVR